MILDEYSPQSSLDTRSRDPGLAIGMEPRSLMAKAPQLDRTRIHDPGLAHGAGPGDTFLDGWSALARSMLGATILALPLALALELRSSILSTMFSP